MKKRVPSNIKKKIILPHLIKSNRMNGINILSMMKTSQNFLNYWEPFYETETRWD